MPNIYESGLSPLIELAKAALPGRRVVTAEDVARLLDPTTGAARRVSTGGVNLQVHPEEWRYLRGPDIIDALSEGRAERGRYTREDVVDWMQNPPSQGSGPGIDWYNKGKGHESYTLPGPRTNYRVRGLTGADGLTDSGDYSYHFADAPVHARLSSRRPFPEGGGPRATHLDELQSDFYSIPREPTIPPDLAQKRDELSEMYRQAVAARSQALAAFGSMVRDGVTGGRRTAAATAHEAAIAHEHEISRQYQELQAALPQGNFRPSGPFEKLWPRLAFNQVANEALDKGHDMVTWSPPWVHDRLYRRAEPGVINLSEETPTKFYSSGGDQIMAVGSRPTLSTFLSRYRGPNSHLIQEAINSGTTSGSLPISGQYWHDPSSLMYHNTYGPRGVVEDSARRFLRAYGEDPAANLTTTRLEGAGWPPELEPSGRVNQELARELQSQGRMDERSADFPAMLITPRMRDIYKRLRDEGRPGVPLYAAGGHVSTASIEDHLLGRI